MNNKEQNISGVLSDEEIVALYWQREERAIRATDQKYGKYLYTIAYNILRDGREFMRHFRELSPR